MRLRECRLRRGAGNTVTAAQHGHFQRRQLGQGLGIAGAPGDEQPRHLLGRGARLRHVFHGGRADLRKARVLELHHFGGMTYDEIAQVLQISASTVDTEMRFAKAWLESRLRDNE